MRVAWFLLLACFLQSHANAQESDSLSFESTPVSADTSQIKIRDFDLSKIEELKKDSDLDYKIPPTVAESLWDRFLTWIGYLIELVFRGAVETNWGRVFLYILGIVLLILIVMMVLRVDAIRVFYSGADRGSVQPVAFHENIHEMDFEKLIQDAMELKEYRLAVRLTFLFALKILSDKQHVEWRPGKTNHDYIDELASKELKTGFNELSLYFDYAWYGHFEVNEKLYHRMHVIFNDWKGKIK